MNKISRKVFAAGLAVSIAFLAAGCEDVRVEKYPNGQVQFETTYVNDKREGLEREFYENALQGRPAGRPYQGIL